MRKVFTTGVCSIEEMRRHLCAIDGRPFPLETQPFAISWRISLEATPAPSRAFMKSQGNGLGQASFFSQSRRALSLSSISSIAFLLTLCCASIPMYLRVRACERFKKKKFFHRLCQMKKIKIGSGAGRGCQKGTEVTITAWHKGGPPVPATGCKYQPRSLRLGLRPPCYALIGSWHAQ